MILLSSRKLASDNCTAFFLKSLSTEYGTTVSRAIWPLMDYLDYYLDYFTSVCHVFFFVLFCFVFARFRVVSFQLSTKKWSMYAIEGSDGSMLYHVRKHFCKGTASVMIHWLYIYWPNPPNPQRRHSNFSLLDDFIDLYPNEQDTVVGVVCDFCRGHQ